MAIKLYLISYLNGRKDETIAAIDFCDLCNKLNASDILNNTKNMSFVSAVTEMEIIPFNRKKK